jgi:hypothetical protein
MMVHFRKRINLERVGQINEAVVQQALSEPEIEPQSPAETAAASKTQSNNENDNDNGDGNGNGSWSGSVSRNGNGNEAALSELPNQGQLIIDASCAPADIRYPTDLGLLNAAREQTEAIIDVLYQSVHDAVESKPRTDRQQARREYLHVAKQRKLSRKTIRKAIRKQLGYLRRNLQHN